MMAQKQTFEKWYAELEELAGEEYSWLLGEDMGAHRDSWENGFSSSVEFEALLDAAVYNQ